MKKVWSLFLFLLFLGGCAGEDTVSLPVSQASEALKPGMVSGKELLRVEEAASVEIDGGDAWNGADVRLDDPEALTELTDMVCSLSYTKGEQVKPMVGCGYRMIWFDAKGEPLADVELGDASICYGDYYYDIADGSINLSRLDQLLGEYWPFNRVKPAWVVLRDEATGDSVTLLEWWTDQPFEKTGPATEDVKGYTLELYDEAGQRLSLLEHITATSFCMDGSTYTAQYDPGIDVERMAALLAASQGEDKALDAFDIEAVTIDNKDRRVCIEDRDVIKEVIAMFADMEITGASEAVAFPDYAYEIHFIEGFSKWSLYGFWLREDGTLLAGERAYTLSGSHFDQARLEELMAGALVERVFPENYLYHHDIDHIELTSSGKTVEIKGREPLSSGMDGSSYAVMDIFDPLQVEKADPAEKEEKEVSFTVAWISSAGDTDREICICADGTLLYDGYVYNIVYGAFDTSVLSDLLERGGKLPTGSPQPTASAQP